jgi:hypothetical protein
MWLQSDSSPHLHLLNPHLLNQHHGASHHAQQGQRGGNHGSATGSGLGSSLSVAGLGLAEHSNQAVIRWSMGPP